MLVQKLSWIILLLLLCQYEVEATRAVACEGNSVFLRCNSGLVIKVIKANYGRTDRTTCTSGKTDHQTSDRHCFQVTSLHIMSTRCDGRHSCSVPAVNSVFSDRCVGTYKYLDVHYVCVKKDALRKKPFK